jgi:hypothetical protein
MIRIAGVVEKNAQVQPPRVVVVAAATATIIFDACIARIEYIQRYIQNVGANRLYYSWATLKADGTANCDNVAIFHGYLEAGQQLDCSANPSVVCVYSVAGTTVATTEVRRNSMGSRN